MATQDQRSKPSYTEAERLEAFKRAYPVGYTGYTVGSYPWSAKEYGDIEGAAMMRRYEHTAFWG